MQHRAPPPFSELGGGGGGWVVNGGCCPLDAAARVRMSQRVRKQHNRLRAAAEGLHLADSEVRRTVEPQRHPLLPQGSRRGSG